jgi:large subunit ribosomal protein L13
MIIDATNLVIGRMATVAAKKALLGEEIIVVNCEKAVITGERRHIISEYLRKRAQGAPLIGPYFPRMPDRIVRRVIRGMLPYKQPKGRAAFKRVMCYIGMPVGVKGTPVSIDTADVSHVPNVKYITIAEICRELGK